MDEERVADSATHRAADERLRALATALMGQFEALLAADYGDLEPVGVASPACDR